MHACRSTLEDPTELIRFALELGVAFQIRDDILNLRAAPAATGKESWGDLWEGKRTLILALFFARATPGDAAFARAVLGKPRPAGRGDPAEARLDRAIAALGDRLPGDAAAALRTTFRDTAVDSAKRPDEVARLRTLIEPEIADAAQIAAQFASRASERWASIRPTMGDSVHRDLIESILEFTITRDR